MKLSVISSLAFAAAMLASPMVIAQDTMAAPTMIGQQTISADDLPKVQAQCNTLAGVAATGATADANASPDGAGDLGKDSETPDGTAAATATIDLSLITIEDCKAAGLAK